MADESLSELRADSVLRGSIDAAINRERKNMKYKVALIAAACCALLCVLVGGLASGIDGSDDVIAPGVMPSVEDTRTVFFTDHGVYFHTDPTCQGMHGAGECSVSDALAIGKNPCPLCAAEYIKTEDSEDIQQKESDRMLYSTPGGRFFHTEPDCMEMMNSNEYSLSEALGAGKRACLVCAEEYAAVGELYAKAREEMERFFPGYADAVTEGRDSSLYIEYDSENGYIGFWIDDATVFDYLQDPFSAELSLYFSTGNETEELFSTVVYQMAAEEIRTAAKQAAAILAKARLYDIISVDTARSVSHKLRVHYNADLQPFTLTYGVGFNDGSEIELCLDVDTLTLLELRSDPVMADTEVTCTVYEYENYAFGTECTFRLYTDGTYIFYESMLSSYLEMGVWQLENDTLVLIADGTQVQKRFTLDGDRFVFESSDEVFSFADIQPGDLFLPAA